MILAIIAFAMAMALLKMVIVAIVLAGLIFRTKETIGLLLIGGLFSLLIAFPIAGIALLVVAAVVAVVRVGRNENQPKAALERQMDDPDQE